MIKSGFLSSRDVYFFLGIMLVMLGLTGVLSITHNDAVFKRFLGDIHPLIAVSACGILGILLMISQTANRWFVVYRGNLIAGMVAMGVAGAFGLIIIVVDIAVRFPSDLNIPFPQSLFFYPVIGYIVEIIFHLLPLMLLLHSTTIIFRQVNEIQLVWMCIVIVALLEPLYQAVGLVGEYPSWVVLYVALHVFLINLFQLILFKRYGFVAMYAFRLGYYLVWHIVWGYIRLDVLF